jgi:hypothetical protein
MAIDGRCFCDIVVTNAPEATGLNWPPYRRVNGRATAVLLSRRPDGRDRDVCAPISVVRQSGLIASWIAGLVAAIKLPMASRSRCSPSAPTSGAR